MEPISVVQSLSPAENSHSVNGRVISSFGGEIDHLLAATEAEAPVLAALGTRVDVRA